MMKKIKRPYLILYLYNEYDFVICVPFRSHIKHKQCYIFKKNIKSRKIKSGLDYTKVILLKDLKYVNIENIKINEKDRIDIKENIDKIASCIFNFIETYINLYNTSNENKSVEFQRKYKYTTLKYFHSYFK